VSGTVNGWTS